MRPALVVVLLGGASTVWAAVPMTGTGGWGAFLVVLASAGVLTGAVRLVFGRALRGRPTGGPAGLSGLAEWAAAFVVGPRWEVATCVSLVVLEALHAARAWHTAVLSLCLVAYLMAVLRAESDIPGVVLGRQARALAAGVGLLAISTGLTMVPSAGSGAVAPWLGAVAALAAIVAGGLALPL